MPNIVEIVVKSRDESKDGLESARSNTRGLGDDADSTGNRVTGMGAKMAKVGAVAAVGMATAAVGIGKALYDVGATMDDMEDKIRVGTGASGEALDGLVETAKKVGTSVPSDFGAVGDAVATLSQRLNITGKPLEDLASQFLNLSRITGTDVKTNIESLTRVFGDWGISADQQSGALDKMFRASQSTGIGIDALAQKVVQFGAPLRQMGFTFEESIAMLGKFEKEGVNSELVMGSMRIALGKIAKGSQDAAGASLAAEKAQKAYNDAVTEHGAASIEARTAQEALTEAQGKTSMAGKEASEVFAEYVQRIKDAGSATEANGIALELFGAKAGPDMAAAIREGRLSIDDLVKSISSGTDTINKASLETMDFAEQWQLTKNRLMVAFEPAAAKVFGALGEAMEANGPKIAKIAEDVAPLLIHALETIISTLETAAPIIGTFLSILSALGPAAGPVVLGIGGIVTAFKAVDTVKGVLDILPDKFSTVATSAVTSFGKMGLAAAGYVATSIAGAAATAAAWIVANIAMIAATGGIILIIAAVIAAIILLVKNWDWVKEKAAQLWEMVKAIWEGIKNAIIGAAEATLGWLSDNWPVILAILGGPLGLLVLLVVKYWDQIVAFIKGVGPKVGAILLDIGRVMLAIMTGGLSELVILVIRKWDEIIAFFKGLPGKLMGALGDLKDQFLGIGGDIIDGIWEGLKRGWTWLTDKVKNLAKDLLNAAKRAIGIGSPSKAFDRQFGAEIPPGAARGVVRTTGVAQDAVRTMADRVLASIPANLAERLRDKLSGFNLATVTAGHAAMASSSNGTAANQQQPTTVVIRVDSSGSRFDDLIVRILRDYIQVQGGDVQAVLGQ